MDSNKPMFLYEYFRLLGQLVELNISENTIIHFASNKLQFKENILPQSHSKPDINVHLVCENTHSS